MRIINLFFLFMSLFLLLSCTKEEIITCKFTSSYHQPNFYCDSSYYDATCYVFINGYRKKINTEYRIEHGDSLRFDQVGTHYTIINCCDTIDTVYYYNSCSIMVNGEYVEYGENVGDVHLNHTVD